MFIIFILLISFQFYINITKKAMNAKYKLEQRRYLLYLQTVAKFAVTSYNW